ncbi:MAG: hypothetical protein ACRDP6_16490 [Actinoallomurus sp.]
MGYAAPKPSEMFSDARNGTEVAERFETYKTTLSDAHAKAQRGDSTFVPGQGIVNKGQGEQIAQRVEAITKGLSSEALAGIQTELEALKSLQADVGKDWSLTVPNSTGLVPYDLEAPAKLLMPRQTPLRNLLPRSKGQGTARQFKRILGWTNSGVGGVGDAMAFMNSESVSTSFGPMSLRRGSKINYASDSKSVAYVEQGFSDMVTWKAQFAGQGFQDIRSLSQTALLWATMGAEERALLYGRGASGNGYAGAVAAPSAPTTATATTGGTIPATTYYVVLTTRAGGGESVISAQASQVTTGSTSTITITPPASAPAGALGYNVYVGTTNGSNYFYQGTTTTWSPLVLTSYTGSGTAPPGADTSANANGYDGFLTVLLDPAQSGYVKNFNGTGGNIASGSPGVGDKPWQDAFAVLYGAGVNPGGGVGQDKRLADPDEVWLDGQIRSALGDWLKKTASTTAYRIALTESEAGGATVGSVVNGLYNQVTGKMVELNVHPYMPLGCSIVRSRTLPVPDSEVSNTSEVINVQDYMAVEWPVVQFTYDQSTYMYGTLVHYAPGWSGAITGLTA